MLVTATFYCYDMSCFFSPINFITESAWELNFDQSITKHTFRNLKLEIKIKFIIHIASISEPIAQWLGTHAYLPKIWNRLKTVLHLSKTKKNLTLKLIFKQVQACVITFLLINMPAISFSIW